MSFAPTDVMDLWGWYDAGVGVIGGTSVTAWEDQSGNGHDLSTTTTPKPATVSSAINGLPAVSSYGVVATMATSVNFPDISTGGTIFLVAKQSRLNGAVNFDSAAVFLGAGGFQDFQIQRGSSSTSGLFSIKGAIHGSTSQAVTNDVIAEDVFYTIRLRNDGTENYIALNNYSDFYAASGGSAYAATPLTIFSTLSGAQGNKQIAEIVIYTRFLSNTEITLVETYLKNKYNHY